MQIGNYTTTPLADSLRIEWQEPNFNHVMFQLEVPNTVWRSNRKSRKLESILNDCVRDLSAEITIKTLENPHQIESDLLPGQASIYVPTGIGKGEDLVRLANNGKTRDAFDCADCFNCWRNNWDKFIDTPEYLLIWEMPSFQDSAEREYDGWFPEQYSPEKATWIDPEYSVLPKLKDFLVAYNGVFDTTLTPEQIRPYLPEYQ